MPLNLQVVEQGADYLTLKWDFAADARSYRLYLDGVQVVAEHLTPDYYRFTNLEQGRSYRLGVSAVGPGGESELGSLSIGTIQGRSASGNFSSSGGSGGRRPAASPSPSPSPTASPTPSPTPINYEVHVNRFEPGRQSDVSLAADSEGQYFWVTWSSDGQGGSAVGVYAQQVDDTGLLLGDEIRVNSFTSSFQGYSDSALDSFGHFTVVWQSGDQDDGASAGIYARRFESDGSQLDAEFRVNTFITGNQQLPDVGVNGDGDFVVAWESALQDGSGLGIYAQRYDIEGDPVGGEFRANSFVSGNQHHPAVAVYGADYFVVAWEGNGPGDTDGLDIFARIFDYDGQPLGSEFRVNSTITGEQSQPDVAVNDTGELMVVWQSDGQDGDRNGIYAQRYNILNGAPIGEEFRVNEATEGSQIAPKVDANQASPGDFIVTWTGTEPDGAAIWARRPFASPLFRAEFRVNQYNSGYQYLSDVAFSREGDYVIGWSSIGQEGPFEEGIFASRFTGTNIQLSVP